MENNAEKTSDFRSIINKNNDGEEPVIIAQRFLNIFRQLHIFSADKKNEFNDMILELPDEIRGMFASLPGGSLLQEYVDSLEDKHGKTRISAQSTIASAPEVVNESKPHIIANAIAENMQSEATPNKPYATPQIDSSFAKEIAQAFAEVMKNEKQNPSKEWFKQALIITEEGRKRDTMEITKAISESQMSLAKTLLQNNTMNASSASNNNANNIQINTTPFPPIEDLVGGIVKAQSELFANMTKTHTKELSEAISHVLKESQLMSTKSIIDTISAFQRENLRFLQSQNRGFRFKVEQSDTSGDDEFDEDITEDVIPSQKKKKKKKKNKDRLSNNIEAQAETAESGNLDQSLFALDDIDPKGEKSNFDTTLKESFIEKLIKRGKGKNKKESFKEENEEVENFDKNIDDAIEDFFSDSKWKFSEELEKNDNDEKIIKEKTQKPAIAETLVFDEHLDDILDMDNDINLNDISFEKTEKEIKEVEGKPVKVEENPVETDFFEALPEDILDEESIEALFEEKNEEDIKKTADALPEEKEKPASREEKWEWQEVFDEPPLASTQEAEEDAKTIAEVSDESAPTIFNDIDETSVLENNVLPKTEEITPVLLDNEESSFIDLDAIGEEDSVDSWGFTEEAPEEASSGLKAETEDEEWEWEEVIDEPVEAKEDKLSAENIAEQPADGEDWEWEYEETEEPVQAAASEPDGEWEWEEVIDEPVEAEEDKLSAEDGEWEWEYEEAEDSSVTLSEQPAEDEDWEWEYEETEEPSATPTEQASNGEEWEWEYEEVEEGSQPEPSVVNP